MQLLPWRVRKVISDHAPLVYHFVANMGKSGNDPAFWDARLAETWDARDWPTKSRMMRARIRDDESVLDVGCGTGSLLRELARSGVRELHGMELSEYACKRLREEGITMWQGSLPSLPVPDARFDVVIASQVLEHVVRRGRFAAEIARVLKPGGRAYIFVPDDCLGPIDTPEHVMVYTARKLERFLARTFRVVSVESFKDENYPMSILFAHVEKRAH